MVNYNCRFLFKILQALVLTSLLYLFKDKLSLFIALQTDLVQELSEKESEKFLFPREQLLNLF